MTDYYKDFKEREKKSWTWFIIAVILISIGMTVVTIWVINHENAMDCAGLKYVLYGITVFHMINFIVASMTLCGLEVKVCNGHACCFYALWIIIAITALQVAYF